jgi:hypothetical protein
MSDTPRTDEEEDRCRECGMRFVSADFARQLEREVEGLRAFKRSVDEALNTGDGSYRP